MFSHNIHGSPKLQLRQKFKNMRPGPALEAPGLSRKRPLDDTEKENLTPYKQSRVDVACSSEQLEVAIDEYMTLVERIALV